ncbi:hypothetical protein ASG52_18255 [Methylobacterium sp. Leaf456]|uniref:AbfB domain-containing protein n=1 Tax=Methylobacterium sp. Leaf456 TaxID=1736382 RepID=UPI0007157DF7|nr:AbfB domain-containing protein [Methylobacterium sp. Leaf456]KQT60070.1 hypothetical protein ASG52_18255 [Methylobacterium sp. Leaf456]
MSKRGRARSADLGLACALALLLAAGPARAQIRIPDAPDPLMAGLAIPASAPERGMWSAVHAWPLIAMHAALTPSGSVLTFGAPPGAQRQDGRVFDIWDPDRGLGSAAHTLLPNAEAVDSFCASAITLPSGAMLISGGAGYDSGLTSKESAAFDPGRRTASAVVSQLRFPRWYGTLITLTDGRALMAGGGKPYAPGVYDVAGSLKRGEVSMTPEIYLPGSGWRLLSRAGSREAFGPDLNRWWYPRMWVGPRGGVFGISSDRTWVLDPTGAGAIVTFPFKTPANADTRPNIGPTSTAVMYDTGRILQVGGNGYSNGYPMPSSNRATVFDLNGTRLTTADVAPMTHPRQWANATVLPDGRVLVTGGSRYADNDGADAVHEAEIWNPATRAWTLGASAGTYRGYHSSAILLPNGTVLTAGGGVKGPVANLNTEIYYPPALFTRVNGRAVLAPRPRLASLSASQFDYGGRATLTLAADASVARVALIGLASATHSFDSGQRYQRLSFTQDGRSLRIAMPAHAGLAPPGYYQLVVLDRAGVPSRGVIVAMAAAPPQPRGTVRFSTLRPVAMPDLRMRLSGTLAGLHPADAAADRLDGAFLVRAGLADPACVSFESRRYGGRFLRQSSRRLRLSPFERSTAYREDATFCPQPGLSGRGTSYELKARPGTYLRARGTQLWLDPSVADEAYAASASFETVDAPP